MYQNNQYPIKKNWNVLLMLWIACFFLRNFTNSIVILYCLLTNNNLELDVYIMYIEQNFIELKTLTKKTWKKT